MQYWRGLSSLLILLDRQCEGLKRGISDKYCSHAFYIFRSSKGTLDGKSAKMHIGKHIQEKLKEKRYSVTWFAAQICCTRTHVYKIFQKSSIDTELLERICIILEYNFFEDISQSLHSKQK